DVPRFMRGIQFYIGVGASGYWVPRTSRRCCIFLIFRMPCQCRFQTKLHPAVGEYIPVFYGLPTTPTRHSYLTTLIYKKYATTLHKVRYVA
ncbi:MAG: hypothetical protein WBE18_04025, partial [Gammaproteobacteria bacterium]